MVLELKEFEDLNSWFEEDLVIEMIKRTIDYLSNLDNKISLGRYEWTLIELRGLVKRMGGRKSYDSRRVTGNSKPVNNNKKSLDKSIKEKKPLDIAYNSAKLSIENQKQSKELFSFLSLSKYVVNEDKLKEKQPTEQKDIKSILDKYSTKNKPITQKEKDLLQKSLNRSRRVKK